MSADAIARLREAESARRFEPPQRVMVHPDDLRALLDAHTALEAAHREVADLTGDLTPEALTRLSDVQGYVRCGDRAALGVDYERGIAEGERRERVRVVAWLRAMAPTFRGALLLYRDALLWAAERIETGEHEEGA